MHTETATQAATSASTMAQPSNGALTPSQQLAALQARLDEAEAGRKAAEQALAMNKRSPGVSIKARRIDRKYPDKDGVEQVGKGNVLIYGLQRFPFSFYPTQVLAILDKGAEIRALIEANKDGLSFEKR